MKTDRVGNDIITIHSPTKVCHVRAVASWSHSIDLTFAVCTSSSQGHALEMLKAIPSEMMSQLSEEAGGQPASSMFSSFDL